MQQVIQLAEDIASCTNCRLAKERTGLSVPAMPGSLYRTGGIALFLEAPGAEEEKLFTHLPSGAGIGKPLIGGAGKLMDQLLKAAGLDREEVLVLNRIRCRPPRNRIIDYPDAVTQCDDWVKKELEAYDPAVVVLCGNTALKSVLGATVSITAARGSVRQTSSMFHYGSRAWIPTFHPAFPLRNGGLSSPMSKDIISDLMLAKELAEAALRDTIEQLRLANIDALNALAEEGGAPCS